MMRALALLAVLSLSLLFTTPELMCYGDQGVLVRYTGPHSALFVLFHSDALGVPNTIAIMEDDDSAPAFLPPTATVYWGIIIPDTRL